MGSAFVLISMHTCGAKSVLVSMPSCPQVKAGAGGAPEAIREWTAREQELRHLAADLSVAAGAVPPSSVVRMAPPKLTSSSRGDRLDC